MRRRVRPPGALLAGTIALATLGCPQTIDVWIPDGVSAAAPRFALARERRVWWFSDPRPVQLERLAVTTCDAPANTLWSIEFRPKVRAEPMEARLSWREIPLAAYVDHVECGVPPAATYRHLRPARPLRASECYDVLADSYDGTGGVRFTLTPDGRVREVRP